MRSASLSLLLAVTVFVAFAALPASLGLISLLRALLFIGVAACLVAAGLQSVAWLLSRYAPKGMTWMARPLH
jgi:hypothetical protein